MDDESGPFKRLIGGVPTTVERLLQEDVKILMGSVAGRALIQTGVLDSPKKGELLLALASRVQTSCPALSSCQISSAVTELGLMSSQHISLFAASKEESGAMALLHYTAPVEPLFLWEKPKVLTASEEHMIFELPKLLNMEALCQYLSFVNGRLQEVFSHFSYDAIDEYTLEGHIVSLHHEVNGHYLKQAQAKVKELQNQLLALEKNKIFDYQKLLQYEKELIIERRHIKEILAAHCHYVREIGKSIAIIEEVHPELIPLKLLTQALAAFLGYDLDLEEKAPTSFVRNQLLLQLINEELGVLSALNISQGVDRATIPFALRLAAMQLKELVSKEEVFGMAIHWHEIARECYALLAEGGYDHFHERLGHVPDKILQSQMKTASLYWELVYENLKWIMAKQENKRSLDDAALNPAYLYILPPFAKSEQGYQPLVEIDKESKTPVRFTEKVRSLF